MGHPDGPWETTGIRHECLCGSEQQSTAASSAWFAARLSANPTSCWLWELTVLSQSSGSCQPTHRWKHPPVVWGLPWGLHDGAFFWLCQVLRPAWASSKVAFALWAGLFGLCRPGQGSDTAGRRQREACPRPLPSPHLSLSDTLEEAFQRQPATTLEIPTPPGPTMEMFC